MSNFSFSQSVFKRLVLQTRKNQGLFGKELKMFEKPGIRFLVLFSVNSGINGHSSLFTSIGGVWFSAYFGNHRLCRRNRGIRNHNITARVYTVNVLHSGFWQRYDEGINTRVMIYFLRLITLAFSNTKRRHCLYKTVSPVTLINSKQVCCNT